MIALPFPTPDLLDGAALFLDFDGTLVDLAETPDSIRVPARLGPLLERLQRRLSGRLAIVSGRSLDDLDRHLPDGARTLSGSHGLEVRFADGSHRPIDAPDTIAALKDRVAEYAAGTPGLLAEPKPAGIALHYRRAPEAAAAVARFMTNLADAHDLAVQRGHMVVELRPRGVDKGDALRTIMREPAFVGARPVFVGDDLTDEHAFRAAAAMDGVGVLVGAPRDTAASFRIQDVAAVAAWLEASA